MDQHSADHRHVTMARLRLFALTTVGGLLLLYQLLVAVMSPRGASDLVWILICVPMYAVGAWLTWRLPKHPQPVRLLVGGSAFFATGAFGMLLASQPADLLTMGRDTQHAEPRGAGGGVAGSGPPHWQLSRRLRRTWLAAAGPALLVGRSHRSTAGSCHQSCRCHPSSRLTSLSPTPTR